MSAGDTKSKCAFGFLTVLPHPQHGFFGGYLVLNTSGRPLEFHCTAPVKPNRAQEILYGPTLEPFLYGEQIGHALVSKSKVAVQVVCTDQAPVLALRTVVSVPVTLVLPADADTSSGESAPRPATTYRVDAAHPNGPRLVTFALGQNRLAIQALVASDESDVAQRLGPLAESIDLAEPFQRIREAIEEAQRAVR